LVIRATATADVPALCALANDPGYRWGTLRLPYQTVEETARWFSGLTPGDHALVAELDGEVVGNAGLHRQRGRRQHVAVLGMGVRDAVRCRGIGSALLAALIDLADNWLDLRRLELTVFHDNAAAIALYGRNGFVTEGVLRSYAFRDGSYVDALMMARLRATNED
jgi:putative acetyltransferase